MKKLVVAIWCLAVGFSCVNARTQEHELIIWSYWGQQPGNVNFMDTVAEEFTKAYGLDVEIVWMEKSEILDKLVFAFDTPESDLTYLDFKFEHPRIVHSLVDLSALELHNPVYSDWHLGALGDRQNVYLPIEGISHAIYYNKDLFQQAKIILPQDRLLTSKEFVEIIKKLRAAGITPIAEGFADPIPNCLPGVPIMNTIFRIAGPEKMTQLLNEEINFSDPDIVEALKFWQRIIDVPGYDAQKALTLQLPEQIFEVTDGHAAINFSGTWSYSKYGATKRDQGQIGVLDWFSVENGRGNTSYDSMFKVFPKCL